MMPRRMPGPASAAPNPYSDPNPRPDKNSKTLKITDHLGSSVFIVKSQNYKDSKFKRLNENKKTTPCKNCEDTRIKREKCILIKSTFNETRNISAVSRKLGVSRNTIYKHLSKLN